MHLSSNYFFTQNSDKKKKLRNSLQKEPITFSSIGKNFYHLVNKVFGKFGERERERGDKDNISCLLSSIKWSGRTSRNRGGTCIIKKKTSMTAYLSIKIK